MNATDSRRLWASVGPLLLALASLPAQAAPDWAFGAVLDTTASSRALAQGSRDSGLQLGHSDLTASGPLGPALRATATASFATHEGRLEKHVEEAWIETTSLPAGLQLRAGRFAPQVGMLNAQHPHADDFVERPLLHRAFLGGHWTDDGLRLNWTAPAPVYLMLGVEALRGRKLVPEAVQDRRSPGVTTAVLKLGSDIGRSHSWQAGLSFIHNRREAVVEDEHGEEDHAHEHGHAAAFSGRRTWMLDGTWKWAPDGNNRGQQLRVGFELARISGINRFAAPSDRHRASAVSVVWRFDPAWEAGVRADWLNVRMPHEDHFDDGRLREQSLMLAWKPSHLQTVRLQVSRQRDGTGFEDPSRRTLQLQVVLAFGAHGAHAF